MSQLDFPAPTQTQEEGRDALRHTMIRQLLKAYVDSDDGYTYIESNLCSTVIVVATLASKLTRLETKTVFRLDDGTGSILAHFWGGLPPGIGEWPIPLKYLRVVGGLKRSRDGNVFHIRHLAPTRDPHELYYHILQAISEEVTLERGKSYAQYERERGLVEDAGESFEGLSLVESSQQDSSQVQGRPPLEGLCSTIVKAVRKGERRHKPDPPDDNEWSGVPLRGIYPYIQSKHPELTLEALGEAVESLISDQYIYCPVERDCYRVVPSDHVSGSPV